MNLPKHYRAMGNLTESNIVLEDIFPLVYTRDQLKALTTDLKHHTEWIITWDSFLSLVQCKRRVPGHNSLGVNHWVIDVQSGGQIELYGISDVDIFGFDLSDLDNRQFLDALTDQLDRYKEITEYFRNCDFAIDDIVWYKKIEAKVRNIRMGSRWDKVTEKYEPVAQARIHYKAHGQTKISWVDVKNLQED